MFRYFFRRLKTHFELDRRQAKIHFVLLWFTLLVLCSPVFTYYATPLFIPQEQYCVSIDTLLEVSDHDTLSLPGNLEAPIVAKKYIKNFSEEDWLRVGLPAYLAKRILKYQAKGAELRLRQDLLKVYGMNEQLLAQAAPFILEEKAIVERERTAFVHQKEVKRISSIDINCADSIDLVALPGIGPVFARRIIQYRSLLKGYVHPEQFKEVYGLSEFALKTLESHTFIKVKALAVLQTCDYTKLNEHLYLSSKDARYIMGQLKTYTLCWDELKSGLEPKAQDRLALLKLYYPCE